MMFSSFCTTLVVTKADRDGLLTLWAAKERVARPSRSGENGTYAPVDFELENA